MNEAQLILLQMVNDLYAEKHWPQANADRQIMLSELAAGRLDVELAALAARHGVNQNDLSRLTKFVLAQATVDPRRGVLYWALQPFFEKLATVARPSLAVQEVEFCVFDDKHGTAVSAKGGQAQLVAVNGALCSKIHVFASHFVVWKIHGEAEELPLATRTKVGPLLQALASQNMWGGDFNADLAENETVNLQRLMEHAYRFVMAHEFGHLLLNGTRYADMTTDPVGIEVCADARALMLLAELNHDASDMAASMEGVAFVLTLLRWALLAKRCHDGRDVQQIAQQFDARLTAIPGGARKLELPIDAYEAECTSANRFFALLLATASA